ncbi:MAG TPA: glycosyltransferase family 2 protein [Bryobacteraceae bacterium]|nr:glycosyltransferase family 2 protein [Bryobacteraceae bacterium]
MVLSVVLPAYNEQGSIEQVILDHERVLHTLGGELEDWEIVCLDDASQDQTLSILNRLAPNIPKLRVLRHERNQGIFQSFHDLFAAAHGTHVYLTASDGQWPAENLAKMLPALRNGADLVVGVRGNRNEIYSASRRVVSYLFNLMPRLLFGVRTSDAGSIKLGLREIFTLDLISRSPFVEAERIIQARRHGHRVEFVPIDFLRRSAGKEGGASWRNVRRSIADCFRCFAHYQAARPNVARVRKASS